jgi:hypothetical protein
MVTGIARSSATRVERLLDRRGCVKLAMLTLPASYRLVGGRQIVLCEPGGGATIVSVPRELINKDRPARAKKVGERPDHSVKVSMVQRHDKWIPREQDGKVRKQPCFIHPADEGARRREPRRGQLDVD